MYVMYYEMYHLFMYLLFGVLYNNMLYLRRIEERLVAHEKPRITENVFVLIFFYFLFTKLKLFYQKPFYLKKESS